MAYNKSIHSFPDIRAALDKCLDSPKGMRYTFETLRDAITFKGRVHTLRYMERKENKKTYPEDHPMWNRSVYDVLMVKTEGDAKTSTVVKIIKLEGVEFEGEEIT